MRAVLTEVVDLSVLQALQHCYQISICVGWDLGQFCSWAV